jgi:hypothetical protein
LLLRFAACSFMRLLGYPAAKISIVASTAAHMFLYWH